MSAKEAEADLANRLPSLHWPGLALLDGGFATHLEDALGQDISSSPLWSASLLETDKGSAAIIQTHLDFLEAGADIVSTSSYQASSLAFKVAGRSTDQVDEILIKSVRLAEQARVQYCQGNADQERTPLLLLSLGPYGAALSDGSEYTGDYFVPDAPSQSGKKAEVSQQELEDFHFQRLEAVARHASAWKSVDVIAFETIPRLDEAVAIRIALLRIFSKYAFKSTVASFVFPNGVNLPWPKNASKERSFDRIFEHVLGTDATGLASPFSGIGINCTKPWYLDELVQRMTTSLERSNVARKPYLFLYPDGGLVWDGIKRIWTQDREVIDDCAASWPDLIMQAAARTKSHERNSFWAGCIIGGCCKSTTADIERLRLRIDAETCSPSSGAPLPRRGLE